MDLDSITRAIPARRRAPRSRSNTIAVDKALREQLVLSTSFLLTLVYALSAFSP
jgi:hypothetical protein